MQHGRQAAITGVYTFCTYSSEPGLLGQVVSVGDLGHSPPKRPLSPRAGWEGQMIGCGLSCPTLSGEAGPFCRVSEPGKNKSNYYY